MKTISLKNYFLSGWIANLGVVPLLLFRAFLFAPILVFLLDLLFRVTLVFETIIFLPSFLSKTRFLPTNCPIVKNLFVYPLVFMLFFSAGHAKPSISQNKSSLIVLSRGEQKEIRVWPYAKISLGNKQVLSHKYFPKEGRLLIKGKSIGFSDLTVWKGSKTKAHQFYVFSKRRHLKIVHLLKSLEKLPVEIEHQGEIIQISGKVTTLEDYSKLSA